MLKVTGSRTCPVCKGIVHGTAYRTTSGKRRRYFDSLQCVMSYFNKKHDFDFDKEFAMQFFEKVEIASK